MNLLKIKSNNILVSRQDSILTAAATITLMVVVAQFLGLVRQWTILKLLGEANFSIFMAAFRLPDLMFEVFVFGTFSSAFIPVFSKYLGKNSAEAWKIAGYIVNIGILAFAVFAMLFWLFAPGFYARIAPGFAKEDIGLIVNLSKIIFFAQGFFIVSYVLTGVLESSKRFFVSALSPVFYNLGIIVGTVFLLDFAGVYSPAIGVLLGAAMHLLVQLPAAIKLGFRFLPTIQLTEGVRKVGKLAAPRLVELVFLQIQKTGELYFASIISTASYAYLNLALSLQSIPITLFGVSLAKASLVALSYRISRKRFVNILVDVFNQMMFIILPVSLFIAVLRIPIVRLTYGTSQSLDWNATLQIGFMLLYYAIGIPFQATLSLLSRAFYAQHDTKTPVVLSVLDVIITLSLELYFVLVLKMPLWSIALANTIGVIIQVSVLAVILAKRMRIGILARILPTVRSLAFSLVSSAIVFVTLKVFDRSVWVKNLSFVGKGAVRNINFESFVLDTRYTINLLILTVMVGLLGLAVYVFLSWVFRAKELYAIVKIFGRKRQIQLPSESITEIESDT